ncbi:MAG: EpsG family protein [Pseudomonadota bacterium]|nr:EpsG family protein [Pseudomonadota bacterium]
MVPYWLLFFYPLIFLIRDSKNESSASRLAWHFGILVFVVMIGFRFEVGGDWFNYIRNINRGYDIGLSHVFGTLSSDPGYALISWLSLQLGSGIYGVNFLAGLVFMVGMSSFCLRQPFPWLGLIIAVPYMIVVFAMGYTRQSIAFGFELIALNALADRRVRQFVLFIFIGALFHKSAVVLIPFAALAATANRLWTFFWVGLCSLVAAILILAEHAASMWSSYVASDDIQSEGGGIRVLLSATPALLTLVFRKRLFYDDAERKLWCWIAVFTLLCFPLVFVASTAVDRVALYFMPIQIVFFCRAHRLFYDSGVKTLVVLSVVVFYALVQFVWLNFANHAHFWLPYQMYPFAS